MFRGFYLLTRFLIISTFSILAVFEARLILADQYTRKVWLGKMAQTSPMPWEGPMELYIRYDPEAEFPQRVEGVITWPELGQTRTAISGLLKKGGKISFSETKCLSGDCAKVVLGGSYKASISSNQASISGKATGPYNLQGSFSLKEKK